MGTRRDFLKLSGLAAAAVSSGCSVVLPTGGTWTRGDIESIGSAAGRNGGRGWAAWQGNREIASGYPGTRGPALSITKSIAALAATRAAAEGWLAASERVCDTLHEWRSDPLKSRITVLMLLQQTSGLEAGVIPLYRNHPADKGRAAVSLRCVDPPGGVFRYGPGHWEVLAEVMRRKLSRKNESLASFMNRSVMRPIGLDSRNWRSDGNGTPYFSTGTELSVTELGRLGKTIGRLLTKSGSDGLDATHFSEMTRPSTVNPMFGGGLWRNSNVIRPGSGSIEVEHSIDAPLSAGFWNRSCLSSRQPADFVALIGSGGRRIYIWPSQGKRIARLGSSASWRDAAFLSKLTA